MATNFSGTWRNQNKSKLELTQQGDVLTGRFESGVGDDGQVLWVDITGKVLGDLITFSAVYSKFRTVVSWVGQHTLSNGAEVIKTHWLHATDIPDPQETDWMWYSNRIGSDVFTKAP